jgi:hypothetical protein
MKKFVKETSKKLATGALAILATIGSASLGVSADPVTITPTNGEDFTINAESEATIDVLGFSTQKVYTYDLNMSWGDMKFVFDRGVYDPDTNKITKKHINNEWAYCEIAAGLNGAAATAATSSASGTGVGYWCGFDGAKNHVEITNKGNGNVGLTVTGNDQVSAEDTSAPAATPGTMDIQLAVKNSDITADRWEVTPSTGSLTTATMKTGGYSALGTAEMKVASVANGIATTVIQKQFDLDGTPVSSQDDANSVEFWINVHNTPEDGGGGAAVDNYDVSNPYDIDTDSDDNTFWATIGSFTLNFNPLTD